MGQVSFFVVPMGHQMELMHAQICLNDAVGPMVWPAHFQETEFQYQEYEEHENCDRLRALHSKSIL